MNTSQKQAEYEQAEGAYYDKDTPELDAELTDVLQNFLMWQGNVDGGERSDAKQAITLFLGKLGAAGRIALAVGLDLIPPFAEPEGRP